MSTPARQPGPSAKRAATGSHTGTAPERPLVCVSGGTADAENDEAALSPEEAKAARAAEVAALKAARAAQAAAREAERAKAQARADRAWALLPALDGEQDLFPRQDPKDKYDCVQDRDFEDSRGMAASREIKAVYLSPWFWEQVSVLPRNDLSLPWPGRPRDYPDWLLFLALSIGATTQVASRSSAATVLADRQVWANLVIDLDNLVEERNAPLIEAYEQACAEAARTGKSKPDRPALLSTLQGRHEGRTRRERKIAKAMTKWKGNVSPLRRRELRLLLPTINVLPPEAHHLDYFSNLLRGLDKNGRPLPATNPYANIRHELRAKFQQIAVAQYQEMGGLDPQQDFQYKRPDSNQYVGMDGVVFPQSEKRKAACQALHVTGTGEVYGTKFTVASARIRGQYSSRVIMDFLHTGTSPDSLANDESAAVLQTLPVLAALAKGGLKGVVVDSAVRGDAVQTLQRQGIVVVNYPHAKRNPNGGPGKRLAPGRVEKSHLRTVASHIREDDGHKCEHLIYAVGGELAEIVVDANGDSRLVRVTPVDYERRGNSGSIRESLLCEIACSPKPFTARIPLFHTSPISSDPKYTWGEVVRVFGPSSAEFGYLYGGRNDTEGRHNQLKRRIKYLPIDVPGQELRLLAAAMVENAVSWQVHCHAHGKSNVLDETA